MQVMSALRRRLFLNLIQSQTRFVHPSFIPLIRFHRCLGKGHWELGEHNLETQKLNNAQEIYLILIFHRSQQTNKQSW